MANVPMDCCKLYTQIAFESVVEAHPRAAHHPDPLAGCGCGKGRKGS